MQNFTIVRHTVSEVDACRCQRDSQIYSRYYI